MFVRDDFLQGVWKKTKFLFISDTRAETLQTWHTSFSRKKNSETKIIHRWFDNTLATCNRVGTGGPNMRLRDLQTSFLLWTMCGVCSSAWSNPVSHCFERLSLDSTSTFNRQGGGAAAAAAKKASKIRKMTFDLFHVGLSFFFSTQVKGSLPHLSSLSSPVSQSSPTTRFRRWSPSQSRPGCHLQRACVSPGSGPEAAGAAAGSAGWDDLDMDGKQKAKHEQILYCCTPMDISVTLLHHISEWYIWEWTEEKETEVLSTTFHRNARNSI